MSVVIKKQIKYWQESAELNWRTAQSLNKLKHFDACLFFCHLALEKLLKALVIIKTDKPAPFVHDLSYLAKLAGLTPTAKQNKELRLITSFNIAGRYADKKFEFYKKCTKAFTFKHLGIASDLRLWLKKQFPKK